MLFILQWPKKTLHDITPLPTSCPCLPRLAQVGSKKSLVVLLDHPTAFSMGTGDSLELSVAVPGGICSWKPLSVRLFYQGHFMFMFINVTLECFFVRCTPWMKHGHSCNSTWNPKVVSSSKTFSSRPNLWASMWNLLKFSCVFVELQKSTSFGVPGVPMKSTPSAWDLRPHGLAAVHGIHGIFDISHVD